jgi:hypothetical protein
MHTGAGAVDYIIDHAEIDVVFIQDKKIKEVWFKMSVVHVATSRIFHVKF